MNTILLAEKQTPTLWENVAENALYVLVFFGIIVAMFLIAFGLEKLCNKKNNLSGKKEKFFTTRKMTAIGILCAMATVLMIFDFPLWFIPSFYKLDFSEIPVLIGAYAFGPATGVIMEFLKILLKLLIKGTSTAFVGELANFVVGCSFIIIGLLLPFLQLRIAVAVIVTLLRGLRNLLIVLLYCLRQFS